MPNAWVEFVRQYAKDNNLSYGCAISEASPAYRALKKGGNRKKEKQERENMMGEDFDTPKTPTKKRITIKKTKDDSENTLNTLKKMKEKEDDILDQSDFFKYQYLAWFDSRNDIPRSDKYKELKKQVKEVCGKSKSECEEVYDDIINFFEKELDYFTTNIFPKILKRINMPNYKIPTETNKRKIKKNDEDFIKEMAKNNDMSIKQAVNQLKAIFYYSN